MTIAAFAAGGEEPVHTAAPVRDGLAVFIAQGCGSCHRFAAAESVGPIGPDLDVALQGKDATFVKDAILAPPPDGPMPDDFATRISPPDLERLVAFLLRAE
jgi:cytochrome c551/c552